MDNPTRQRLLSFPREVNGFETYISSLEPIDVLDCLQKIELLTDHQTAVRLFEVSNDTYYFKSKHNKIYKLWEDHHGVYRIAGFPPPDIRLVQPVKTIKKQTLQIIFDLLLVEGIVE